MEESPKTSTPEQSAPQLRGLYKNVNISVKSLNVIIVVCILAMLLLVAMELLISGLMLKLPSLSRLISGSPVPIIKDGRN